ncbi:tRNA pseudouridine(13) synthase TruD [Nanoarchaeota archaeon]
MYKIKHKPEDFIVKELIDVELGEGNYFYYTLKKKNYSTPKAIEIIAKRFKIPLKNVGFAGNKDKVAVTEQKISIKERKIPEFKSNDLSLIFVGKGSKPINLGDNKGNYFEIIVRNISTLPERKTKFINYFGKQRFSEGNVEIGRSIVKKDFKKAVELILKQNQKNHEIQMFLDKQKNNHIGALKILPLKMLKFYIHAYQSDLWNKLAEKFKETQTMEIPLIGFATEVTNETLETEMQMLLKKEDVRERDFIIRSLPEISSEGSSRKLFVEAQNLDIGALENDELNEGMKKVLLKFDLESGSYATVFIDFLFRSYS